MKLVNVSEGQVCLKAYDYLNLPYYKTPILRGKAPFKLVLGNDGRYGIYDAEKCIWLSHALQ